MPRLHVWAAGLGGSTVTLGVSYLAYDYFYNTKISLERSLEAARLHSLKFRRQVDMLKQRAQEISSLENHSPSSPQSLAVSNEKRISFAAEAMYIRDVLLDGNVDDHGGNTAENIGSNARQKEVSRGADGSKVAVNDRSELIASINSFLSTYCGPLSLTRLSQAGASTMVQREERWHEDETGLERDKKCSPLKRRVLQDKRLIKWCCATVAFVYNRLCRLCAVAEHRLLESQGWDQLRVGCLYIMFICWFRIVLPWLENTPAVGQTFLLSILSRMGVVEIESVTPLRDKQKCYDLDRMSAQVSFRCLEALGLLDNVSDTIGNDSATGIHSPFTNNFHSQSHEVLSGVASRSIGLIAWEDHRKPTSKEMHKQSDSVNKRRQAIARPVREALYPDERPPEHTDGLRDNQTTVVHRIESSSGRKSIIMRNTSLLKKSDFGTPADDGGHKVLLVNENDPEAKAEKIFSAGQAAEEHVSVLFLAHVSHWVEEAAVRVAYHNMVIKNKSRNEHHTHSTQRERLVVVYPRYTDYLIVKKDKPKQNSNEKNHFSHPGYPWCLSDVLLQALASSVAQSTSSSSLLGGDEDLDVEIVPVVVSGISNILYGPEGSTKAMESSPVQTLKRRQKRNPYIANYDYRTEDDVAEFLTKSPTTNAEKLLQQKQGVDNFEQNRSSEAELSGSQQAQQNLPELEEKEAIERAQQRRSERRRERGLVDPQRERLEQEAAAREERIRLEEQKLAAPRKDYFESLIEQSGGNREEDEVLEALLAGRNYDHRISNKMMTFDASDALALSLSKTKGRFDSRSPSTNDIISYETRGIGADHPGSSLSFAGSHSLSPFVNHSGTPSIETKSLHKTSHTQSNTSGSSPHPDADDGFNIENDEQVFDADAEQVNTTAMAFPWLLTSILPNCTATKASNPDQRGTSKPLITVSFCRGVRTAHQVWPVILRETVRRHGGKLD